MTQPVNLNVKGTVVTGSNHTRKEMERWFTINAESFEISRRISCQHFYRTRIKLTPTSLHWRNYTRIYEFWLLYILEWLYKNWRNPCQKCVINYFHNNLSYIFSLSYWKRHSALFRFLRIQMLYLIWPKNLPSNN